MKDDVSEIITSMDFSTFDHLVTIIIYCIQTGVLNVRPEEKSPFEIYI